MSNSPLPTLRKIEDEPLWKEANSLADYFYSKADDFPDSETWYTASKLRNATLDMLFYVSEALGGLASTTVTDWSYARKAVSALKTLYPFVARQNFIELEPEIMVRLRKMVDRIDIEIKGAHEASEKAGEAELDQWREKYKMWKKMDDK